MNEFAAIVLMIIILVVILSAFDISSSGGTNHSSLGKDLDQIETKAIRKVNDLSRQYLNDVEENLNNKRKIK